MAGSATGAAQENPFQIRAVAHGDAARRGSVRAYVVSMKHDIRIPFDRMLRSWPAQMALRTRRSTPLNPFKVGSVTGNVGAASRAVQFGIASVQGVGKISPLDRMDRLLVAEMTLRTGDIGSPPGKIIPMAIGAG